MSSGTISTLGIGSGLDLQDILDQLKEVEKAPITAKEESKAVMEQEVTAYNALNAKLYSMKSKALSLSLESDFLKNSAIVDDEEVLTATVSDGVSVSSASVDVTRLASYSSWQTEGVASEDSLIYAEPTTTIAGSDEIVTTGSETLTIQYGASGDQQEISIELESDMTLNDIVSAIASSEFNQDDEGNALVTASVETNSDGYSYIRIAAASGGNTADSQVSVSGLDYIQADVTISLALSSDDPIYVSVPPGTTYAEIADLINNASDNPGITAAVIDDGTGDTPYRLTLTADETGEDNRISIQNLPMTEVTGADDESLNASFTVNGITYQRQSNDGIGDVISGMTLSLKSIGTTSVGIERDTESIKENILALVDTYNEISSQIKGTTTENEDGTETSDSVLADSTDANSILRKLKSLLSTTITNGTSAYTSLFDLGLSLEKDGTITLDEDVLDEALASDPEGVRDLFIGNEDNGVTGLGDTINDGLTSLVGSDGVVTTEIDELENKIDRLDSSITAATERLDKRYDILQASFVRLDTLIAELNSQSEYLQSVIDSFNNSDS